MPVDKHRDPFRWHRLALRAVHPGVTPSSLRQVLQQIEPAHASTFAKFLLDQGLGAFWHEILRTQGDGGETAAGFLAALERERLSATALYMAQKRVLREVDVLFGAENISYVAIKGTDVRERIYADPALRPACDIDILIRPDQREVAARALIGAGFSLHADPENISHEATFSRSPVDIDLHWDILRPGRTRIELALPLLARRKRVGDFRGLDDSDAVFLMLVHPAFAKYVGSPGMGLHRVLDFMYWTHRHQVDWDAVAQRLDATGLKAAAWTVLQWFAMLLEPESLPVPASFIARISPGRLRSQYLNYWLRHDLPTRWLHNPLWIQIGLTLVLHDRLGDTARAVLGWVRSRRLRRTDPLLALADESG